MKTRRVRLMVPIELRYDSKKGLAEALQSIPREIYVEIWSTAGFHWKTGRPRIMNRRDAAGESDK